MKRWLKRLRGILGLGVLGGVAGALFGGLWWVVALVLGGSDLIGGGIGVTTAVWAFFGAFAAGGSGLLLATLGGSRSLEDLSPLRIAAFGAAMGALAPSAFLFLVTGSVWVPGTAFFVSISSAIGAVLGGGLVVAAKRAPTADLAAGGDPALEPGDPLNE